MMQKKIDTIVIDTSAFIRNAPLQDLAENFYTVQNVVDEVTHKSQLQDLEFLPYRVKVKEPFPESIAHVTEFSKKTGDYPSLSATDIRVLALAYEFEKQLVGTDHLKAEPTIVKKSTCGSHRDETQIAGFHMPTKKKNAEEEEEGEVEEHEGDEVDEDEYSDVEDDEEEESDDEDSWITPNNLKEAQEKLGEVEIKDDVPTVACVTSDFAMQNVLRQMGLTVVSADAKLIKDVRTYILRCYACFKTTTIMTKVFCPKCGNKTLKRVAVTLNEDGSLEMHFSKRPLTARGKQQNLPTPKGGKHAKNQIRCEDQPVPQQRATRLARAKNNPMDPDYIAGMSPFAVRDTSSRAAMLGINSSWSKRGLDKTGIVGKSRKHK
ncbi:RNA-binding protein NOB1 isoform X2 [Neocloeon triangulifer]|uniref:RNA-binding protein NOB1 isoform X2 n=1 Tax=Neocloeon triangulifer TaxID=2078957 RepID=UPI00286F1B2B|nr:RNA-binding protein NOB1 isoform X2 [Neocloeon triangulifer]